MFVLETRRDGDISVERVEFTFENFEILKVGARHIKGICKGRNNGEEYDEVSVVFKPGNKYLLSLFKDRRDITYIDIIFNEIDNDLNEEIIVPYLEDEDGNNKFQYVDQNSDGSFSLNFAYKRGEK